VDRHR
jgi:transposase